MSNLFNSISIVLQTKDVLSEVFEKYMPIMLLQIASGSKRSELGVSIEPATRPRLPNLPLFSWMNGGRVLDNIILGYERSV
jgi:hypothetical protein